MNKHLQDFKDVCAEFVCQMRIIDISIKNDKTKNKTSVVGYLKHADQEELRRNITEIMEQLSLLKQQLEPERNPVQNTESPMTLDSLEDSDNSELTDIHFTSSVTDETQEARFLDDNDSENEGAVGELPSNVKSSKTINVRMSSGEVVGVPTRSGKRHNSDESTNKGRQLL